MWAINLRILAVVLITLGTYTLIANSIPQVESEVPEELVMGADVTPEQLVAAGEELYYGAGGCEACHGLGTRAPHLLADEGGTGLIGARCAARVQGASCKEYLHASLVEPAEYVVPGYQPIMPDMDRTMSPAQVWSMVAFLESQGGQVTVTGQDIATAEGAAGGGTGAQGTAAIGRPTSTDPGVLVRELGCLACHRVGSEGGAIGPQFDGMGSRIGRDGIRRGILAPNADTARGYEAVAGVMPATFGDQLSAAQLEALVDYIADPTGN